MRIRTDIEHDHKGFDYLSLEVLLDIRELLSKTEQLPVTESSKVKRHRRTKKEMAAARKTK